MDALLSLWWNSSSRLQEPTLKAYIIPPIGNICPPLVALLLLIFVLLFILIFPPLVISKTKIQRLARFSNQV